MNDAIKATIDTSNLLTILGLVAAVWALIPSTSRLSFRLSVSTFDWTLIIGVVALAHYLVFEETMRAFGIYFTFGPWKWGLDKNSAVYLLLISLTGYLIYRSQSIKVQRRNIHVFERLSTSLINTKKYDELAPLLERHAKSIFALADHRTLRDRIAQKIRPTPIYFLPIAELDAQVVKPSAYRHIQRDILNRLASHLEVNGKPEISAREVVRKILTNQNLIAYLAVSYPYLCIEILKEPLAAKEEFSDLFIQALIEDESSIFYAELKNNHNLNGHHRLALPPENRLLKYFFSDVSVAAKLGIYRPVGETVCRSIEFSTSIGASHNGPLGYYDEVGKYKCPIFCGIHFFQIMVHEGIHQGIHDHLWLHYFTHFTDKILLRLRPLREDDSNHEFPSPFHFLLYKIVSISTEWIDEAQYVNLQGDNSTNEQRTLEERNYIPLEASQAVGLIMHSIVESEKLDDRFKVYMLEVVLGRIQRFQNSGSMDSLARALEKSIIYGYDILTTNASYKENLFQLYQQIDHPIRGGMIHFTNELNTALATSI